MKISKVFVLLEMSLGHPLTRSPIGKFSSIDSKSGLDWNRMEKTLSKMNKIESVEIEALLEKIYFPELTQKRNRSNVLVLYD